MKKILFLFVLLTTVSISAQIENEEYFYDNTSGLLNAIHGTIKVDDGVIISGEINEGIYEHPVILKIDKAGELMWSTFNTTKIGLTLNQYQNPCADFDIKLFDDGYIYGVYYENASMGLLRKFWKVNATTGEVVFIKNFYQNSSRELKICDYDDTKFIATYKRPVLGTENMAMFAYISKQTGDTIKKYEMGTCNWDFGAQIDKNKNVYYWRENMLTKYNRDSLALPLWTKTYNVYLSNPIDRIQDVYIDYQDNIFVFGNDGGSFGYGDGIVAKVSNQNGAQIWNTRVATDDLIKSSHVDRNGKIYVSYRHAFVGGNTVWWTAGKLDKATGALDWNTYQNIVPIGAPNGSSSDKTAILAMDIDCNGDLYTTGYYGDANYGPATWGNMKISGATGIKIYDQTVDLTPSVQDNYSEGLGSFVFNNQSVMLGQLQNLSSPNFWPSDAYYSAYDTAGNNTVLKRIGAEFSTPSKALDVQVSGDTLFVLKQQGKYVILEARLHGTTPLWTQTFAGSTDRMPIGGLMKVTPGAVILVYKENLISTTYPYDMVVSDKIRLTAMNRNTGQVTNTANSIFTNAYVVLTEMEADNAAAFISYEKDGNTYLLKWNGGSSFAAPVLMDLAGSPLSFKGSQNCMLNTSGGTMTAVDNLQIKHIAKSSLAVTNVFTFPTPREYYDIELRNNKLYMVGKDQLNNALYTVYDFVGDSLTVDSSYAAGAFFQIDHDAYQNLIITGESADHQVTARYINIVDHSTIWQNSYDLGTTDNKTVYSAALNPHKNVITQTGSIARADGSSDLFINTINFYGESLFNHIAEDLSELKSTGIIAGYSPDSTSLVGGNHNRHISSREGVIFSLDSGYCNRLITGVHISCSDEPTILTASAGSQYQWMKDGQVIPGATAQEYGATEPGSYNCIFTDLCGQDTSIIAFYTDTLGIPPSPVVLAMDSVICSSDNALLIASPAYQYEWFLDGVSLPNSNTDSLFVNMAGGYTVKITTPIGCTATSDSIVEIDVFANTNNIVGSDTLICPNLTGILVSDPHLSYQWYLNGEAIAGATDDTLEYNTPGWYNIVTLNNQGCTDSLSTGFYVGSQPSITVINGTNQLCDGEGQTLSCTPSQSYQWYLNGNPINGATNNTLAVTGPGNYNVEVINSLGCSDSVENGFAFTYFPVTEVTFSVDTELCENDAPIPLSATPSNGTFSGAGTSGTQFNPVTSGTGDFYVHYTGQDINNCAFTDSVLISVNETTSETISVMAMDSYTLNGITYTASGTYTQTLVNANGCDSLLTLILDLDFTGIEDLSGTQLVVYPNPSATGVFNVQGEGLSDQVLIIRDARGRLIAQLEANATTMTIDLSEEERGVYFVTVGIHHFAVVYQ